MTQDPGGDNPCGVFLNKLNRVTVTAKILEEIILVEFFK